MREDIKRHLDESIPSHITLTEAQKNKIIHEVPKRMKKKKFKLPSIPLIVSLAIISLSLFLVIPYLDDDLQQLYEENLVDVTIPYDPYASLIRSIYVDDSKEMIYTDWNGIYAYSVETNTKEILVTPKEEARIHLFAVNENWLAWEDITTSTLNVLNRNNNEVIELTNTHVGDIHLQDDTLLIYYIGDSDNFMGYRAIELTSMKQRDLHEITGNGSRSLADVQDNLLVVPEEIEVEGQKLVKFYLYDIEQNVQVAEYQVPYEIAEFVTLTDNKIFAQLSNEDENSHLGYIDLEDGKLHEIKTPLFSEFAVYKDYVALSVLIKDSTTVKLYQIEANELRELPAFKNISERLVRPRFTDDGMLIVNGEGAQRTMYLQDLNINP
ncbi:hypothetical protein KD050_06810 [Psychrobacillus sp. INOP01]|uniref:hypothetical protein n=1 Tax=Psychrobacillus sp. INOP01 TaxID=2829187 RepID=UPI001BA506DC|nr:hypothetical protein [Psychrobacillus sp. INOP01]QUG42947.1 hypothetical protein KD050_06810 [Psychrobacillus sp. INOP01]